MNGRKTSGGHAESGVCLTNRALESWLEIMSTKELFDARCFFQVAWLLPRVRRDAAAHAGEK